MRLRKTDWITNNCQNVALFFHSQRQSKIKSTGKRDVKQKIVHRLDAHIIVEPNGNTHNVQLNMQPVPKINTCIV